ncbi:MAG: hypothetical protein IOC82_11805 [Aestuariivirga sp.]|uniref:glycosyltransferase family 32 protein n=1 Tax=Aestuariivirga sp. TaxID=2650926 RepID=UPI0025C29729|nr:glycosyltransferase [Aestuariivirga sp.]MCA3561701.1 hypothetical protein [Aestuariivirga sp.]
MTIPKKLFQTAKAYDILPGEIKDNIRSLRDLNPDWDYSFFDDAAVKAYLEAHLSPEDWEAVQLVNPRFGVVLADLFRYLVIYREGGVYLDIKSTARKPLTAALDLDCGFVLSQWPNKIGENYVGYGLHPELSDVPGGEFQQWNIIAAPRHPFLQAAVRQVIVNIKSYTPGRFGTDAYGVLRLSGPIAYTRAIYPLLDHFAYQAVDLAQWGIHYSLYGNDGGLQQQHQSAVPGHYSKVREPVVLKEVYVEPPQPVIAKLADLLAKELRDNIGLVLKLAVLSIAATLALVVALVFLAAVAIFR